MNDTLPGLQRIPGLGTNTPATQPGQPQGVSPLAAIEAPAAQPLGVLPKAVTLPAQSEGRPLSRIPRSNLKAMTVKFLKDQGGVCPLCKRPIDLRILREGVVDHDHATGEVRGVLHRSCNGAEGKVANAAGRWGAGGMALELVLPWLKNLVAYYEREGTGYMYPTHETPEQKAQKAKLKRRTTAANKRATAKVRSMKKEA